MDVDMLTIPLVIQGILALGYAGYWIAHAGLREHLNTTDVIFRSLVYGLIGLLGFALAFRCTGIFELSLILGFLVSIGASVFWRILGRSWLFKILHISRVSSENGYPSTIHSVIHNTAWEWTHVNVILNDGTELISDISLLFQPHSLITL